MSDRLKQSFEVPYINLERIEEIRSKYNCNHCLIEHNLNIENYPNRRYFEEDEFIESKRDICQCNTNNYYYANIFRNNIRNCECNELNANRFNSENTYNNTYFTTPIRKKNFDLDENRYCSYCRNCCNCCNANVRNKLINNERIPCRGCDEIYYNDENKSLYENNVDYSDLSDNISDKDYINDHFKSKQIKKLNELSDLEENQKVLINRNNRKIIGLALNWISLSGDHNRKVRKFVLDSMESRELINIPHFIILFQYDDHKGVRGIYTYSKEDNNWYCVIEIIQNCPRIIGKEMIHTLYKFDTCQKLFKPIKQSKIITDIVDGLSIKNEFLNVVDN